LKPRVAAIGIDGGDLRIFESLKEELPTFKKLMDNGIYGNMKSTMPPVTSPAWFSLMTGKNPGKIGHFHLYGMKHASYDIKYCSSSEIRTEDEIWGILNNHGYTCGIINEPLTYPAREIEGYMVPGFLSPQNGYETHPVRLKEELDNLVGGYEIDVRGIQIIDNDQLYIDASRCMRKRTEAGVHLLESYPVDFFMLVYTGTDRIFHAMLNDYSKPMVEFLKELDSCVEDVISRLDDDTYIIVFSDHGFKPTPKGFFINQWLEDNGYLKLKENRMERIGVTQRSVGRVVTKLGLKDVLLPRVPDFVKKKMALLIGKEGSYSIVDYLEKERIDWKNTYALGFQAGGIFLNTSDRPQGILTDESVKREIIEKLKSLKDPWTGETIPVEIIDPKEIYHGDRIEDIPDIQVWLDGGWHVMGEFPADKKVFRPLKKANHDKDALLMLSHNSITQTSLGDCRVEDFTPTVLGIFGIEPNKDMDGINLLQ